MKNKKSNLIFDMNFLTFVSLIVGFVSLVVAFVSLIISINSFKISERVYVYSSKDYSPDFQLKIGASGNLNVINKSSDIFNIIETSVLEITSIVCIEKNYESDLRVPFVTLSYYSFPSDDPNYNNSKEELDFRYGINLLCAFDKCAVNEQNFDIIKKNFITKCNKNNFEMPYIQSPYYIVKIVYVDNFGNKNSLLYRVYSLGGAEKISQYELDRTFYWLDMPRFTNWEKRWNYILTKYRTFITDQDKDTFSF